MQRQVPLSLPMYLYVCLCTSVSAYVCLCLSMSVYISMDVYVYRCSARYLYVCLCLSMYLYDFLCLPMYVYVSMVHHVEVVRWVVDLLCVKSLRYHYIGMRLNVHQHYFLTIYLVRWATTMPLVLGVASKGWLTSWRRCVFPFKLRRMQWIVRSCCSWRPKSRRWWMLPWLTWMLVRWWVLPWLTWMLVRWWTAHR